MDGLTGDAVLLVLSAIGLLAIFLLVGGMVSCALAIAHAWMGESDQDDQVFWAGEDNDDAV